MSKHILHVVTNIAHYPQSNRATGLWLGELSHAYDAFEQQGYQQTIVSPLGGQSPIEPKSLSPWVADASVRSRYKDPAFMALLEQTVQPAEINWQDYDAIYYTGGHGVMWDFLDQPELQHITQQMYMSGAVVASVCHGYCALLNIQLADGQYLIQNKKITGFSWTEEILAGVSKLVPYNAEQTAKLHGAIFSKCRIPYMSHVVSDGNLITGQNPFSARATAAKIIEYLEQG